MRGIQNLSSSWLVGWLGNGSVQFSASATKEVAAMF
jgi:hypothetical protein